MSKRHAHGKAPSTLCGEPISASADVGVVRHVAVCLNLLVECSDWLRSAKDGSHGAECQRKLILHLGSCLHQAVYGMLILVKHDALSAALVLERSTLEYYGRAAYFAKHVDHAVWIVSVERIQAYLDRAASVEEHVELSHLLSDARRQHIDLAPESRQAQGLLPFHQVKIADMLREGLGADALRRYRAASVMLHGDPYAGTLARHRETAANAALLQAASGIVSMSNLMLSWLERPPRGLTERVLQAEDETNRLFQRYGDAYLVDGNFAPDDGDEELDAHLGNPG